MENRSGAYIKQLSGDMQYKSFRPALLQKVSQQEMDSDFIRCLQRRPGALGGWTAYRPASRTSTYLHPCMSAKRRSCPHRLKAYRQP